jgi:site-specific recombinase XerD
MALPKMRMGEIRALSQIECGRVLRAIDTNPSPFRKVRDRAIIVTFLLTGARLQEMVVLNRGDIDLGQSTIRLHRKGGDIDLLPLADAAKQELKSYLKQRRKRSRARALAWEDENGKVWLTYITGDFLKSRHGIEGKDDVMKRLTGFTRSLVENALE